MRATKPTGRGGRQRLEKVGRRALSKAAAYVIEQRNIQPTMYVHTSSGGTMPIVLRDLPFDEKLAFERISRALREMTKFVAERSQEPCADDDRKTFAVD